MIKLIIAGGREFNDYESLSSKARLILKGFKRSEMMIISGTARGADRLGEAFANQYNLQLMRMPADWQRYGRRAGYVRNEEMAVQGSALLACWDGRSRGTKHMIDLATRHGLDIHILRY